MAFGIFKADGGNITGFSAPVQPDKGLSRSNTPRVLLANFGDTYYNSFVMDGLVLVHADSFWCRDDVLESIKLGVDTFTERFGKHVDWWDDASSSENATR